MLKTFNMALIRCPAGFSEEIIAVFQLKENLKLPPKKTKNPKFYPILKNFVHFSNIFDGLCGLKR